MAAFTNVSSSEKLSIKQSGNGLRRYGSTCNHIKRPEHFIIHKVQKTDTLQGLALKYNSTTEQIRRVNRLFASDSLFLRGTLKIPVAKEIGISDPLESNSEEPVVASSSSFDDYDDDDTTTLNNLFGKIDMSIAETRAQVRIAQEQSHFLDHSNSTNATFRQRDRKLNSLPDDPNSTNTPQPVVLSHGRKVRNSLQRLEEVQDALFEL